MSGKGSGGQEKVGDAIWVVTEPSPLRAGYYMAIQVGPDLSFTPGDPLAYVTAVSWAIETACHDSAVARQISHVSRKGGGEEHRLASVAAVLGPIREAREAAGTARRHAKETAPLTFAPVVAGGPGRNFHPSVHVSLGGEPFCQWDRGDCYSHLAAVLGAIHAARLDSAYREVAMDLVSGRTDRAAAMVEDLLRWRDPE